MKKFKYIVEMTANDGEETDERPGLGYRIAQARKQIGMSQVELGKAIGVSQQTVVVWERSRKNLRSDTLIKLSKILKISVDALLGLNEVDELTPKDIRLWRKLLTVQELPDKDRKVITETIDALTARNKTKESSSED